MERVNDSSKLTNINSRSKFSTGQVFRNVLCTDAEAKPPALDDVTEHVGNSFGVSSRTKFIHN
jgi:hypothetical protein